MVQQHKVILSILIVVVLHFGPYPSNRYTLKSGTNNQYTIDNRVQFVLNQGNKGANIQIDQTLPTRCADIVAGITYLSKSLSQLTPNNNVTAPSTQPGPLNLYAVNVDANGIAVFQFIWRISI